MPPLVQGGGISFGIQIQGLQQLVSDFSKFHSWLANPAVSFKEAQKVYGKRVEYVFASEGHGQPYAWAPLSLVRMRERRAQGLPAHPTLTAFGDLRRAATMGGPYAGRDISFRAELDPHEARWILEGEKVGNEFGFLWHVNGRDRVVPPRPFWPQESDDWDAVFHPFVDWYDAWESGAGSPQLAFWMP